MSLSLIVAAMIAGQAPTSISRVPLSDLATSARQRVAVEPSELVLEFQTGVDDLRGNRDNLHVFVQLRDGRELKFLDVNKRRRWFPHSSETVILPLPDGVGRDQLAAVRLETTFGGGIGGDNWDLKQLRISVRSRGTVLFEDSGEPLYRLTGDEKVREVRFDSRF